MGTADDYIPIQLTRKFRDAQFDNDFQGWLKMQEAAMQIEFPVHDCPEIREDMYSKHSLAVIENKLLQMYPDHRVAFNPDNVHTTMRYVYYVGETFRRNFEGIWVVLPSMSDPTQPPTTAAIDYPMREAMNKPAELVQMALGRRKGNEITRVYGYAERDYNEWIAMGKPARTFLRTLRED